jgi:hypothetical protein
MNDTVVRQAAGPFALRQFEKRAQLLDRLVALTAYHEEHCAPYSHMLARLHAGWRGARSLEDLPWLPVGVFKRQRLTSVADELIVRELRSSGTSSSVPSRVYLDRATAEKQTRALAEIVGDFLGTTRRPMLIIDQPGVVGKAAPLTARGAAILGFSTFGRHHSYALRADLGIDWEVVESFLTRHGDQPILLFGFTFIVWQHLVEALAKDGRRLSFPDGSILLHGGGWKKLELRKVDAARFRQQVGEVLGVKRVHDYYGMAEQVGSIFMECEHGRLHVPGYAEVIVRDPHSLAPLAIGGTGIIQVLSELPRSYPGHSLLTEDVGQLLGEDDCVCGRGGRTLRVEGRLPKAEVRGCSDTAPG